MEPGESMEFDLFFAAKLLKAYRLTTHTLVMNVSSGQPHHNG
jgi:hypothetical protein